MLTARRFRQVLPALLIGWLTLQPARALINLDEGRSRIYVSGTFSAGYDSNLYARANGDGDSFFSADLESQFVRRAGLFSLNGLLGINATTYDSRPGENFQNPRLQAVIGKETGRTTGSLTLSAARESRADSAANIRNDSNTYQATLTANYDLLSGRYGFVPTLGFASRNFTDNNLLADLDTYSASLDFYYRLAGRNLLVGYRVRDENASAHTGSVDQALTVGVSGRLFGGLTGNARVGYQVRSPTGDTTGRDTHHSWTSSIGTRWNLTRRLSLDGQLSKDYSTTSTNVSVDTLAADVRLAYQFNTLTAFTVSTSASRSDFLDQAANAREDTHWSWDASLSRTLLDGHLRVSLSYSFSENWSTEQFADFNRNRVTVTASTQY